MNPDIAADYLRDLFLAHGIASSVDDGWVLPASSPHAIRATWHPSPQTGRLDVHVLVGDGSIIEEAFAGIGAGEAGLKDALASFTVNSFHVLLAAFWDMNDPDQVTTERWTIHGSRYTAYIGNFGSRASEDVEARIPQSLFPRLAQAIQHEHLQHEMHWFRFFFFCNLAGEYTYEALRDNEDWEGGRESLQAIPWESSPGYYSVRLFLMLRRMPSEPARKPSFFNRLGWLIPKGIA